MQTKEINNIKIRPVVHLALESHEILGFDYFSTLYSNIYICSRRRSGKTTLIYNILKHCVNKRTNVVFFCSTINRDSTYKLILEMLEKKKVNVMTYDHFLNGKENILTGIIEELNNDLEAKEQERIKLDEEKLDPKPKMVLFPEEKLIERKPRKPKKLSPEYIFIFDDLGSDLRHASITQLFKTSRHYKAKVIVSSQYVHDLSNSCIKNLDYTLVFKSFNREKLLVLFEALDLSIDFELFEQLYLDATAEPFNFLYVDSRENTYRKNFNKEYLLKDNV
jgi:hypothetical protein